MALLSGTSLLAGSVPRLSGEAAVRGWVPLVRLGGRTGEGSARPDRTPVVLGESELERSGCTVLTGGETGKPVETPVPILAAQT